MNNRIRKLRKTLDLTQKEFAERIGIKQNTVATYEIGRSIPIDAVISLICREFNVNETWLRSGEGEMFRQDREATVDQLCAELHADNLETEIIRAYFRIDERIRLPFLRQLIQEMQSAPVELPATEQNQLIESTDKSTAEPPAPMLAFADSPATEPETVAPIPEGSSPEIEAQVARIREQLILEASTGTSGVSTPAKAG